MKRPAYIAALLAAALLPVMVLSWLHVPDVPPPSAPIVYPAPEVDVDGSDGENGSHVEHQGWAPDAVEALKPWTDQQAAFQLVSRAGEPVWQDNSRADVRLWALLGLVASPSPPNGPQLTGDCTAWSSCHAAEKSQAGTVFVRGGQWKRLFPAFSYGVGRVNIWAKEIIGGLPSEGCSVSAIGRGMVEYGMLAWDDAKDPHGRPYEYSGQLADSWGRFGPPKHLYEIAAQHKLKAIAPMKSAADVRNALGNGYAVACGSDFTAGNFRTVDGRIFADNIALTMDYRQRWHHALCIDGYDGTAPGGPKYHIQNSWYPTSHPAPIDGSPACGFWVSESTIEYMVKQNDAFSFPDVDGFEAKRDELELNLFPVSKSSAATSPGRLDRVVPRKTTVSP